jgi:futalosine hydrolase
MRALLVVAATGAELCGHEGLVCGVGPVEAAAATARALALEPPAGVLHVGVAGATGIEPGTLVVGSESVYEDLSAAIPVTARCSPDERLLAAARAALPAASCLEVVTSAAVSTASTSLPQSPARVEAMEGFGVLRACALAGVPAVEVRAVSNAIGEADRSCWRITEALAALGAALPGLVEALDDALG